MLFRSPGRPHRGLAQGQDAVLAPRRQGDPAAGPRHQPAGGTQVGQGGLDGDDRSRESSIMFICFMTGFLTKWLVGRLSRLSRDL